MKNILWMLAMLAISLLSGAFALSCYKVSLKAAIRRAAAGRNVDLDEIDVITWPKWIMAQLLLAAASVGLTFSFLWGWNPFYLLAGALLLLLIVGAILITKSQDEKRLAAAMVGWIGVPFTAGLLFNIGRNINIDGWKASLPEVVFLIAPVLFYIVINAIKNGTIKGAVKTLACMAGILLVAFLVTSWAKKYPSKQSEETTKAEATAEETEAPAEETEPTAEEPETVVEEKIPDATSEGGIILTKGASVEDAMLKWGILTDEDKEIQAEFGENAYSAVKTAEETGSTAAEVASLGAVEEWQINRDKAVVPFEVRWKSFERDRKDGSETHVISSAKSLGYVDYDITDALEFAFEGEKDDLEAITKGIVERLANPLVAGAWIRGTANVEFLGKKAREIEGNEFFNEFILEDRKAFAKDRQEFEEIMKEDAVPENKENSS